MLKVSQLTVEGMTEACVTDARTPRVSFRVESDMPGTRVAAATLRVGQWSTDARDLINLTYAGPELKPFTTYPVHAEVTTEDGRTADAYTSFETGRMDTPWGAQWITDGDYRFTEKKVSPRPMVFRREVSAASGKQVVSARLYATAMGIYDVTIDGKHISDYYFAPGFTSYKTNLQYQTYDVTDLLVDGQSTSTNSSDVHSRGSHTILATVTGGWAVGSYVFTRENRVTTDKQAFLAELRIVYSDGSVDIIGTDESWQVSMDGPVTMADFYDGETYDARDEFDSTSRALTTVSGKKVNWKKASATTLKFQPHIQADYSARVCEHEVFAPVSSVERDGGEGQSETIYDLGQNFAGIVRLRIARAQAGQVVTVKHAEILNPDGSLNTQFLRTAQATLTYTCVDGEQSYSPRFTYMGFRYVSVSGISPEDISIEGVALYSDIDKTSTFECSHEGVNQLHSNIMWSSKSNFVDIPTDCPQRDERMGWTGDIAVFAPTACYNFDMSRFLTKWLKDVKAEQNPGGGIPNTVPVQGYGFPATMPRMAIDWWGDACILVPWALYQATGDVTVLSDMYETMTRYVKACTFWAGLFSFGHKRYIWNTPSVLHFGDWVAPDEPHMSGWQKRAPWTATASLHNTSRTLAQIAQILGRSDDAQRYTELAEHVAQAYCTEFSDGRGTLAQEFQTAYVLPLHQGMFPQDVRQQATDNLVRLIEKANYTIGTGFPGTPYILFALADQGRADVAYSMLLNTLCPSWLYEVKQGATTIWERWDGLDESGQCPIGDDGTDTMISYNHYASGAVGAFLYSRVAGIEPLEAGYKRFTVRPVVDPQGLRVDWAKSSLMSPYGKISSSWAVESGVFTLTVSVPVGTQCEVVLPSGVKHTVEHGEHSFQEILHTNVNGNHNGNDSVNHSVNDSVNESVAQ